MHSVALNNLLVLFCAEDGGQILGHLGSSIKHDLQPLFYNYAHRQLVNATHVLRSIGVHYLEFNVTSN